MQKVKPVKRIRGAILVLALTLHGGFMFGAQAQGRSSAFDGAWAVIVTCSSVADGALGYTMHFPATVTEGSFRGENGIKGSEVWMLLEGPIQPDGNALLWAHGLTGNPANTVGRVSALTPYSYHVRAHFDSTQGQGTRVELRPCTLNFGKS